MLTILFFIVVFVLLIIFTVISSIFGFIRSLFSALKPKTAENATDFGTSRERTKSRIFDKNEGEYVDFEEIN